MTLQQLEKDIKPLRNQLINHQLYQNIDSIENVRLFMEQHVFAVWDFMSLLKALQIGLTSTTLPWIPKGNPISRRLINEIVLGEESDVNELGEPMSHFEMYIDAMEQIGANTSQIRNFLQFIENGMSVQEALTSVQIDPATRNFVNFTFDQIETNKLHIIAAVFTFGREDLIPDMFIEMVKNIGVNSNVNIRKLNYYLERHIEVDGGEHGPMALKMIHELCEENSEKWMEAIEASKTALQQRINLWDSINAECLTLNV